ncbi:MAG: carbohydrate-binding domain-containing protein [Janthinobacterium lividum]
MRKSILLASLAIVSASPAIAQTCPSHSDDARKSLGVGTSLSWGYPYTEANVSADLQYLGVQYIRDQVSNVPAVADELVQLGQQGIKIDYLQGSTPAGEPDFVNDFYWMNYIIARTTPTTIVSMEGLNEYNISHYTFNGVSSYGNLTWGRDVNWTTLNALASNPATARISYIAASIAGYNTIPSMAGTADQGNWHIYAGDGFQLSDNIRDAITKGQASVEGPMQITETGDADVSTDSWGVAGDSYTQAVIIMNGILESLADGSNGTGEMGGWGVPRIYLHDLIDNGTTTLNGDHFGLFTYKNSAKPVAVAIHNWLSIMKDSGANAGSFLPTALSYYVAQLPAGAFYKVFQKSNGAYDIVIWNGEATVWANGAETYVPTVQVLVGFANAYQSIKVFDPLTSDQPINVIPTTNQIAVGLSKDPIVVEIANPVTPPTSTVWCPTDAIDFWVNGDSWGTIQPQLQIKIDGVLQGNYTITADRRSGQSQHIYVLGSWGTGQHTITAGFINDAWGGSDTTDVNANILAVSYDGQQTRNKNVFMGWVSTALFQTVN